MELQLNWVAIAIATVVGMGVGVVWFAKPVFGRPWRRLASFGPNADAPAPIVYIAALLGTAVFVLTLAVATSVVSAAFGIPLLAAAFAAAGVPWLGVLVPRHAAIALFQDMPRPLFLIYIGHDATVLVLAAVIIGLLG